MFDFFNVQIRTSMSVYDAIYLAIKTYLLPSYQWIQTVNLFNKIIRRRHTEQG